MRAFIVACCLLASASAAYTPTHRARLPRPPRDVSELAATPPAYEYLPPEPKLLPQLQPETEAPETTVTPVEVAATTAAPEPESVPEASSRLGVNGYEYRVVRRHKYRTRRLRRDVSHLAAHYLPPAAPSAAAPHSDYLPPANGAKGLPAVAAAAPVDDTEEVVAAPAPAPKVANDYLPPQLEEIAVVTEPADLPEAETEAAVPEELRIEPEAPVEPEQDTAVLDNDGYHYKQPAEPALLKEAPPPAATTGAEEYLPPLTDDTVAVEGPEDTAVLANDGYHYRTIRRLRFF